MITELAYVIEIYANLRALQLLKNIKESETFIENSLSISKKISHKLNNVANKSNELILLIPVYNEEKVIKDTILFWEDNLKKLFGCRIVIITTDKENKASKNKTYQVASKFIKSKNIEIYHSKTIAGKGAQLNDAIKSILKKEKNADYIYFGIFDVDSRPDIKGIKYVVDDEDRAEIYQMYGIYHNNYSNNNLANANVVFQTRWSLAHELPTAIKNYEAKKVKNLSYCIGHGLFIRGDFAKNNKFKTYTLTEDLAFGYKASYNGILIKPIPFFDHCSVPLNLSTNIKQSGRWFAGELLMYKEYKQTISNSKNIKSKIESFWKMIKRYSILSHWILGPPINVFIFVWSIIKGDFILMALPILFFINYVIWAHLLTLRIAKIKIKKNKINLIFWITLKSILNCVGPWYSLYRMSLEKLGIKPYDFFKTPKGT